jgi:hypothetical protein
MGLFDRTAKRLADGPTLLLATEPADELARLLARYDPAVRVRGDRLVFRNGVVLHGPVEVTADLARKAGLPAGVTTAYYAGIIEQGSRGSRPDDDKWQDAERLVRGLAGRLGATVHNGRPPMDLKLRASVFSSQPLPAADVVSALRPYFDHEIVVDEDEQVKDAYYLITREEPLFFVAYWPPRLSQSRLARPPPALGPLRDHSPSRWDFRTKFSLADAGEDRCRRVGEAAFALAGRVNGTVIDTYGFALTGPGELRP